jgi:hypothetical protein
LRFTSPILMDACYHQLFSPWMIDEHAHARATDSH